MKPSRVFHQTSTPISELCVDPSPPSFKRLSLIPPIGKKKRSSRRSKIVTSNLRRRLVTSDRNTPCNSIENFADDSQRESSSTFHSILYSKNTVKATKFKTTLRKSLTNKRKSILDKIQIRSLRESKICKQKPVFTGKKNVVLELFSFEKDRKSLSFSSNGKNANELETSTKMATDKDEYLNSKGKRVSRSMHGKVKNRKKLKITNILQENCNDSSAKYVNVTENDQSYSILKSYTGRNIQKEISICDIVSNECVNEFYQKNSASFIRRRSEELQKKCLKPSTPVRKTKGQTKLRKRLYRNPYIVSNERELFEISKEDSTQEMSFSNEKSVKVTKTSVTNETKISETDQVFDFCDEFLAGLEWHMKQVPKPKSKASFPTKDISNDDMHNCSSESVSIDSITSFQSSSKNNYFVAHADLSKESTKDVIQFGNRNEENPRAQIESTKQYIRVESNRREVPSENLELDVITNKCTNSSSGNNKKDILDLKSNKKSTRNQSKVNNQQCPRKSKLKQVNILPGAKGKLLDDTFSYPSTSTPFDSPEVQTKRLSSVIRNLSPVIEETAKTNANYLDDIEPTLSCVNKTYGKDSHPNSTSRSTALSKSDRLFLSMSKISSGMNSEYKTATSHSKSDELWFSMMESLSRTNSNYKTALSKTNGSLLENTKPTVSKIGKETSEITLFESPPKELSNETSGKDHEEDLPTKLVKQKRESKKVIKTNKRNYKNSKETRAKNVEYSEEKNKTSQLSKYFEDVSNWSLCIEQIKTKPYSTFYH